MECPDFLHRLELTPPSRHIALVNRARDKIAAHIVQLNAQLNVLAPINMLPQETLVAIFTFNMHDETDASKPGPFYRCLALSHVCRQWRAVAHSAPLLWVVLTTRRIEATEHCLSLSKQAPLVLSVTDARQAQEYLPSVRRTLECIERIRELELFAEKRTMRRFAKTLDVPAPLLDTLYMVTTQDPTRQHLHLSPEDTSYFRADFLGRRALRLREVHLIACVFDWDSPIFSKLTVLDINAIPEGSRPSLSQYHTILVGSPDLQDLSLCDAVAISDTDIEACDFLSAGVCLSSLAFVKIGVETALQLAALLRLLSLRTTSLFRPSVQGTLDLTVSHVVNHDGLAALRAALHFLGRTAPNPPPFGSMKIHWQENRLSWIFAEQSSSQQLSRTISFDYPKHSWGTTDLLEFFNGFLSLQTVTDVIVHGDGAEDFTLNFLQWLRISRIAPRTTFVEIIGTTLRPFYSVLSRDLVKVLENDTASGDDVRFTQLEYVRLASVEVTRDVLQILENRNRHGLPLRRLVLEDCTDGPFEFSLQNVEWLRKCIPELILIREGHEVYYFPSVNVVYADFTDEEESDGDEQ